MVIVIHAKTSPVMRGISCSFIPKSCRGQKQSTSPEQTEAKRQGFTLKFGRLFVLSGPTGVGKDTIAGHLSSVCRRLITTTTRKPRPGEINGVHYNFISKAQFEEGIRQSQFLEWTTWLDHYYGVPEASIQQAVKDKQNILLIISPDAAIKKIKKAIKDSYFIYLAPPSRKELINRFNGRRDNLTEEQVKERIATIKQNMKYKKQFDIVVVNKKGKQEEAAEEIKVFMRHPNRKRSPLRQILYKLYKIFHKLYNAFAPRALYKQM